MKEEDSRQLYNEAMADGLRFENICGYRVFFEKCEDNWCAFCPTLLGCVSTGDDGFEECVQNMEEAIKLHLEGMEEDGDNIPEKDY